MGRILCLAIGSSEETLSLAHAAHIVSVISVVIAVRPLLLLFLRTIRILKNVYHAHILVIFPNTGRLRNFRVKLLNFCEIDRLW